MGYKELFASNQPHEYTAEDKEAYKARKKVERDELYQWADDTANRVFGDGDEMGKYLDLSARVGLSTLNSLLVYAQNPGAIQLHTYDEWKKQNRLVTETGSGIDILKKSDKEIFTENGPISTFNRVKVFDVTSTVPGRYYQPPRREHAAPPSPEDVLKALIQVSPVRNIELAETLPGNAKARFDEKNDTIHALDSLTYEEMIQALSEQYTISTLDGGPDKVNSYFASLVSGVLCRKYKVPTKMEKAPAEFRAMEPQELRSLLNSARGLANAFAEQMDRSLTFMRIQPPKETEQAAPVVKPKKTMAR